MVKTPVVYRLAHDARCDGENPSSFPLPWYMQIARARSTTTQSAGLARCEGRSLFRPNRASSLSLRAAEPPRG